MPTTICQADESIQRKSNGKFKYPLGVYPVEELTPKEGYISEFEPADGGDDTGDWEEWPDRYVMDVVVSAEKLQPLCRQLFAMMPPKIYPILDVLGHDAYREVDPHISYDLVGLDIFLDGVMRFKDFLYEDGLCGFGAMSESPFFYVFVDEHKIVTLRVEASRKDRLERLMESFDLEASAPGKEPVGADGAAHEHRTVLLVSDNPRILDPEEVVEELRDEWRLVLNVDPESNVDDDGNELGRTAWRCVIRCDPTDEAKGKPRYAEVLLDADNLHEAEETAFEAVDELRDTDGLVAEFEDEVVVSADRLDEEGLRDLLGSDPVAERKKRSASPPKDESDQEAEASGTVRRARWLE
jgi:hypothetical protein